MAVNIERFFSRREFIARSLVGVAALGLGVRGFAQDGGGTAPRRKLGIALCGLGGYARDELGPALRNTAYCRLAGVVTGDAGKGRRWAREYGFPESSVYGYDNMDAMRENPDIDILYSVTPPSLHKRDTLAGFAAGKHVISEKPMAPTVADCDEMIAAARRAGKSLSIGYRLHFHPYFERVAQLAREGEALTGLSGGFGFNIGGNRTWRLEREMGGGPLGDVGLYPIYCAALARNGEVPVAVSGKLHPVTRPEVFNSVEEGIDFTLEYADGATLKGETSWSKGLNYFLGTDDVAGKVDLQPAYNYRGLRGSIGGEPLPERDDVGQQARQMDAIALAILEGRESPVPGSIGRRDIHIIESIFESARNDGKRVAL